MNKQYISEAFDALHEMQNMKTNTKDLSKESTRAYDLVDLIVDYEDILGYCTEDEKGQDVYVKYNTHTNECVVYQRDASGLPVIISFSTIPISRYRRKVKQEYIDELPATEYGKSVYR